MSLPNFIDIDPIFVETFHSDEKQKTKKKTKEDQNGRMTFKTTQTTIPNAKPLYN